MLICIGITGIVNSGLYLGMNTFIMPRFDLQTVCETVQSRRISYLYVVPPVALQLVQSPWSTGTICARYACSIRPRRRSPWNSFAACATSGASLSASNMA